jgi:hypothetical protein
LSEGLLSLHWKDSRLAFDPEVTGSDEKYFQGDYQVNEVFDGWWPQLYLVNDSGDFERQGTTLRITAEGDLFLSEEIDAVAKSRMNLRRFPFDRQQFVAIFEVLGANSDLSMESPQRLFSASLKAALLRHRIFSTPAARMPTLRVRAGHCKRHQIKNPDPFGPGVFHLTPGSTGGAPLRFCEAK